MSAINKNQEKEDVSPPSDSDDDFKYEEVYLEDDWSLTEGEEDLEATTEWTEMVQKGLVDAERVGVVPDVYIYNQRLESELKNARREREEYRLAASAAAETLVRVQKARDFHRLQHKRVVQEKNRLIEEMRKLKVQCNSYEPAVKRMNEKYQAVLKQTVLVTLERDEALKQANRRSAQHNICLCGDAGEQREARAESQESGGPPIQ
ncbi:sperm-associated antigen 16 protein-like [Trachinotus anak]|uniref:sperm-associated antigen 16 protein-like n=1 Tax=Trachinotus anak TaxID=443729 RepID=UPI0039F264DF